MTTPAPQVDTRFGEPGAGPTTWDSAEAALAGAELYWLTTVRNDGRPHTTPLVGLWREGSFWFCTGPDEQKRRNLDHQDAVTVTTGTNTWKDGLDLVVEGTAVRARGAALLQGLADAYRSKYGGEWDFAADDEVFDPGEGEAHVFQVVPRKVLAFGKGPHSQTRFRF